jgi:hypothetical protein
MLQLHNTTPFAASAQGIDTLYVKIKGPLLAADVYWKETCTSSLKCATNIRVGKPVTDIVMMGHTFVL